MASSIAAAPPDAKAQVLRWQSELAGASPEVIIRFAVQHFGDRLAVATQFGVEGCTLLHRVAQVSKTVRFFTIDTGLLFQETYDLATRLEETLGIRIARIKPDASVGAQAVAHGPNLWERDPDLCCTLRKVQPMQKAMAGMAAWMTAVRRGQTDNRKDTQPVEWDEKFGLVKFCPLAAQSKDDVEGYAQAHAVPTNPLRLIGYTSLGCFPCTGPATSDDPRSGRWWRTAKTECGLHTKK